MTYTTDSFPKSAKFEDLIGATLRSVDGLVEGGDRVAFRTADGREFLMHHQQDCCESVCIESVVGDVADLIGHPIRIAEMSCSNTEHPPGYAVPKYQESFTWTFYKLATIKGYVDIRWLGESNGHYGEEVDFELVSHTPVDSLAEQHATQAAALKADNDAQERAAAYANAK